jgi:hypothetical protein
MSIEASWRLRDRERTSAISKFLAERRDDLAQQLSKKHMSDRHTKRNELVRVARVAFLRLSPEEQAEYFDKRGEGEAEKKGEGSNAEKNDEGSNAEKKNEAPCDQPALGAAARVSGDSEPSSVRKRPSAITPGNQEEKPRRRRRQKGPEVASPLPPTCPKAPKKDDDLAASTLGGEPAPTVSTGSHCASSAAEPAPTRATGSQSAGSVAQGAPVQPPQLPEAAFRAGGAGITERALASHLPLLTRVLGLPNATAVLAASFAFAENARAKGVRVFGRAGTAALLSIALKLEGANLASNTIRQIVGQVGGPGTLQEVDRVEAAIFSAWAADPHACSVAARRFG